jgi:hypothetical protein
MTDTTQAAGLTKDQIRAILMDHGFTIKEGQTDLKPYVYRAAGALIEAALAAQAVPAPYRFIEALRTALDHAGATEKRAEIVGHFCNGLNELFSASTSHATAADIDEAALARMTQQGAKAWSGVDPQSLRDGSYAPAEAKEEPGNQLWACLTNAVGELRFKTEADARDCQRDMGGKVYQVAAEESTPQPQAAGLIERLKGQAEAHRHMAETDSAQLIDEAVSALAKKAEPIALMDMLEETRDTLAKVLIKVRRDAPDLSGKLLGHADAVITKADAILDHIDTTPQPQAAQPVARVTGFVGAIRMEAECLPHNGACMALGDMLYAAPVAAPALTEEQERDKKDAQRYRRCRRILAWQLNPNRVATSDEVDAYVDSAQLPSDPDAALRSTQGGE